MFYAAGTIDPSKHFNRSQYQLEQYFLKKNYYSKNLKKKLNKFLRLRVKFYRQNFFKKLQLISSKGCLQALGSNSATNSWNNAIERVENITNWQNNWKTFQTPVSPLYKFVHQTNLFKLYSLSELRILLVIHLSKNIAARNAETTRSRFH